MGFYEPIRGFINRFAGYEATDQIAGLSIMAGAASGAVGGMSQPAFLDVPI